MFDDIPGLTEMIARGYVVAATDYPGLGTPGTHPYLIGVSEGRAVLDMVRAAMAMPEPGASERFVVWGHSQGGHAALFTGELARQYAPELKLLGVAAAAPATYLGELFAADIDGRIGRALASFALWSWSRIYDVPLDAVLFPQAIPAFERVAAGCIEAFNQELGVASRSGRCKGVPEGEHHPHGAVEDLHRAQHAGPRTRRHGLFHRPGHGRHHGSPAHHRPVRARALPAERAGTLRQHARPEPYPDRAGRSPRSRRMDGRSLRRHPAAERLPAPMKKAGPRARPS